jgi:uncharacterized protein
MIGCLLALSCAAVVAQTVVPTPTADPRDEAVPPAPQGHLSDFAQLLPLDAASRIEAILAQHEQATGLQVAVAVVPSIGGVPLEDYSARLFSRWKIGREGKDDGVILLVALRERQIRIEVGYGLEGAITDGTAGEIIRNAIAPEFKRGDYAAGIEAGVQAIIAASQGEGGGPPARRQDPVPIIVIIVVIAVILFVSLVSRAVKGGRGMTFGGGDTRSHGGGFWGGGSFGGGGFGGGGFSGGGGSFGGGGASGGW